MHPTTAAVRAMYEQYPYPPGVPQLRVGTAVRPLLSLGRVARPAGRPLRVLDAGCGRGLGTIGLAATDPSVHVTGIDINRVGLAEARREADRRGLANVELREIDLMTLDGLDVPPGGYDLVVSSGVIHHLADPATGLARLAEVLAPHGILDLMVYARYAREPLYRMVRAIDVLVPRDRPLAERLAVARPLTEVRTDAIQAGIWRDTAPLTDVQFVDRYINVQETAYDVAGLFALLEGAGLRFLRHLDRAAWSVEKILPPGDLLDRARALPELEQYRLVEQLCWRERLEVIACRPSNGPRLAPTDADLVRSVFRVHPEVGFSVSKRNLHDAQRVERVAYKPPFADEVEVRRGAMASAVLMLAEQFQAFSGDSLVGVLVGEGHAEAEAIAALRHLFDEEIVYRPHPADA